MKVKEKYQGLNREQLLDQVAEIGANYELYSGSCSQSTVAAIHEVVGLDDSVVKVATYALRGYCFSTTGYLWWTGRWDYCLGLFFRATNGVGFRPGNV